MANSSVVMTVFILWMSIITLPLAGEETKSALPRKDCFFGLHFDLHPNENDTALGRDTSEENIRRLLERAKPDFVQYDCKGHRGYCGYPSTVGSPAPGIVNDALAVWRKVTKDHGVGLYVHFSGVWDNRAIELHPEWARIDAEGKPDNQKTSTFGPYVDELLVPQLSEVVSNYQLDGVWVDGECWAVELDYSPAALKAWKEKTGYDKAPTSASEPHWQEWKSFHREQFLWYLNRWVNELHRLNPGVQITSNWMFTSFAPIPVTVPLDFLSGDYSPGNSVDTARLEARYLASTNMPWDLMAWGFDKGENLNWSWKTPIHLMQEASVVLMQGGGFQIYYQPTRAGYVPDTIIDTVGQVSDFCHARKEISFKSESVPQVALLLSSESQLDRMNRIFSPWGGELRGLAGALHALLELHYSVDVLAEHQLQPRLREYPLVVLPDTHKLSEEFQQALLEYVADGGNLLLLSAESARLFQPILGVEFQGEPQQAHAELATGSGMVNADGKWQPVEVRGAKAVGYRHPHRDARKDGEVAATVANYGKGKAAAVYGPIALSFYNCHHPAMREFIGAVANELFPEPMVRIDGPAAVDIALRKTQDGRLALHMMNRTSAPVSNRYSVIDSVPAVGPIQVSIALPEKPKRVYWMPEQTKLKWRYTEGRLITEAPSLHVHGAVVIE